MAVNAATFCEKGLRGSESKTRSIKNGAGRSSWARFLGTFVFIVLIFAAQCIGQTSTGEVTGLITDPSGAFVPNVSVKLTNNGTQEARSFTTKDDGAYDFPNLDPGTYTLDTTASGFKKSQTTNLTVAAGDRRRADVQLQIGAEQVVVEVTTTAATLQTDSSSLNSSLSSASVANLPLNGRNYNNLVQIVPGATEGNPTGLNTGNSPDDRRPASNVSINSQSDVLNNNMIDGLDNNERIIGTIGVRPSIDSIQEVKILTNSYTADSGRAAGAIVNVITKSGSNTYHGSLYEYWRNDILNAYSYQFGAHNAKPKLRQNQFGGSLGGFIFKDKTFIFGDAEFLRIVQRTSPASANVPTAYQQAHPGDFSDVNPGASVCNATSASNPTGLRTDPTTYVANCAYMTPFSAAVIAGTAKAGMQYPNNVIPKSDIDPVGLNYFSLYSPPNNGSNYVGNGLRQQYITTYDVRVDHHINANNSLFGRFSANSVFTHTPASALPAKMVAGLLIDGQNGVNGDSPQTARNMQLNFSHTFTQQLVLTLGAGYTLVDNYSTPPNFGLNPNTAFGEPGINFSPNTSALGGVTFGNGLTAFGAGRPGFVPLHDKDNTYQINGAVFYTKGKQSFKMGAALIRRQALNFQESNGMGNIGFQNGAPGLLTGYYSSAVRNNNYFTNYYRTWEPSFFFQDDWRVSQKLTLNLGVRWDEFTPFVDKYNHISNFFPNGNTGTLAVANTPGVSRAANVNYTYTDFAPRAGFAFSATPKTVLRGGFGLSFFPTNQASAGSLKNQPWIFAFGPCSALTCGSGFNRLSAGLPTPPSTQTAAVSFTCVASSTQLCYPQALNSSEPNYRDAYLEQFNLTLQQQFGANTFTISYVGALGRHLGDAIANTNLAPLGSTSASVANLNRLYHAALPNLTNVPALLSDGSSSYNGLQATISRALTNGLAFTATTTWAHNLDNTVQIGGGATQTVISLDPTSPYFHGRYDYSDSDLDQRNRFVFQGTYTPRYLDRFSGASGTVLKGWSFNVLSVWTTGLPFTVSNSSNVSFTTPNGGADRPNRVGDSRILPPVAPGKIPYFNPLAFASQPAGTVGNSRRNLMHGPASQHVDAAIAKSFPIREPLRLNFRAEGFNLLNSALFANPTGTLGSANLGYITATRADYQPRVFQFALRLEF